ncbi:hypothetical protein [Pontibacterium sp.]|uniref:hypothetical protein n=1 Tax=Pontibacterium sp. TaxID=2036026 RepID=UPI003567D112
MNCYTLAPASNPPDSLVSRFQRPAALASWYRYGSYCPDTVPAFIVTYGPRPEFNIAISESQIVVIDSESDAPPALQALVSIGSYLFDPDADSPIVMDQRIGGEMCLTPHFRLIDFNYEDSGLGKARLQADCLAATGVDLDRRRSLSDLKEVAHIALENSLGGV